MPALYEVYMQTCKRLHPEWQFKLWNEASIEKELGVKFTMNKVITSGNVWAHLKVYYANKILEKMGGVLLDTDTICLKPLDELTHKFSFFGGLEPATEYYNSPPINGGAIGTTPHNPIVKRAIELVERYYNESETEFRQYMNEYSSTIV